MDHDECAKFTQKTSLPLAGLLPKYGVWLARRWRACKKEHIAAEDLLSSSGVAMDVLRAEWALQVSAQTRPLPRKCVSCNPAIRVVHVRFRPIAERRQRRDTSYSCSPNIGRRVSRRDQRPRTQTCGRAYGTRRNYWRDHGTTRELPIEP